MCDENINSKKLESLISPTTLSAFGNPHRLSTNLNSNFENLFEYQLKKSKTEKHQESISPVTATSIRIKKNGGKETIISQSPRSGIDSLFTPTSATNFWHSPIASKLPSPLTLVKQISNNKKNKNNNNNNYSNNSNTGELTPNSALRFLNSPSFLKSEFNSQEFQLTPVSALNEQQIQEQVNGLVKKMEEQQNHQEEIIINDANVHKPPTPKLTLPDFSIVKRKKKNSSLSDKMMKKKNQRKKKKRKDELPEVPPPLNTSSQSLFTTTSTSTTTVTSNRTTTMSATTKRDWNVMFRENEIDLKSKLFTKTRCEDPISHVSEKMYSSLKYEIRHSLQGEICGREAFLLGRIFVVDSTTGNFIQKKNKAVLKGVVECALTKPTNMPNCTELKGNMKVQFTDVSYHHKKGDFCWEVHYFRPSNLNKPILIMRSAPFKVFARKPSQKKRARSTPSTTTKNGSNKKRKMGNKKDNTFDDFVSRLDDLMNCFKKLKNDEEKIALDLVTKKLNFQQ